MKRTESALMASLSTNLRPQSWAGGGRGLALGLVCGLALVLITVFEVLTLPLVTVSALFVFPVLVAAWLLSLRSTLAIAFVGVALQAVLAWINAIDWITAGADIGAFALMAVIGHVAGENWLAMHRGLERERTLLQDQERSRIRLEALLEVAHSILEGMSLEDLMRLVASRARSLAGSAMAAVAVPDEDRLPRQGCGRRRRGRAAGVARAHRKGCEGGVTASKTAPRRNRSPQGFRSSISGRTRTRLGASLSVDRRPAPDWDAAACQSRRDRIR